MLVHFYPWYNQNIKSCNGRAPKNFHQCQKIPLAFGCSIGHIGYFQTPSYNESIFIVHSGKLCQEALLPYSNSFRDTLRANFWIYGNYGGLKGLPEAENLKNGPGMSENTYFDPSLSLSLDVCTTSKGTCVVTQFLQFCRFLSQRGVSI